MNITEFIRLIVMDAALAAVAAIGFAVISNPSRKAVAVSAILAAIGHSLRYVLIKWAKLDIAMATFVAASCIGLLSILFARIIHCPAEVFSFPSLLPMIPGLYAYRTILGLIKFMRTADVTKSQGFMLDFAHNGLTTMFILFALVVGVSLPVLFFPKTSFSVTRKY
jgi:uncharacterized membrane protein YjjB (DUF3815 family)